MVRGRIPHMSILGPRKEAQQLVRISGWSQVWRIDSLFLYPHPGWSRRRYLQLRYRACS
jgi:hypothetical protein